MLQKWVLGREICQKNRMYSGRKRKQHIIKNSFAKLTKMASKKGSILWLSTCRGRREEDEYGDGS